MENYFHNGNVQTAQQKLKAIKLKEEQELSEKNRYEQHQRDLSEYLKEWFKSYEIKTEQFHCRNYTKDFLESLKTFVESRGYFYNHLEKNEVTPGMFGHPDFGYIDAFIIATYKVPEKEFKW